MADLNQISSDRMFYDENKYTPEVRPDEDGFYRWSYTLDRHHDRQMYRLLLIIWAVIAVGGAVIGFLLAKVPPELIRQDPSGYQNLLTERRILYAILGYAAFFAIGLLITGLIRLTEGGPSTFWYRMNGDFVQIQPSGKGSGVNLFSEVKRIEFYPEVNEIRLISRWGKGPVLVRHEDYALIREHILKHVPEKTTVSDSPEKTQ